MKLRTIVLSGISIFLFSCGSKVAVTTMKPDTVQVPPKLAASPAIPMTAELAAGKNLYDTNCANCHKLYDPTAFTMENWRPILVRMQKQTRLDDAAMGSIANYINSQL